MSDNEVLSKQKFGCKVTIYQDHHYDYGGENFCEILYLQSSRYTLGTKAVSKEEMDSIIKDKNYLCIPVYAHVHGESTISTKPFGCRFDSGRSGIACVSKETMRKEYGVKKISKEVIQKATELIESEVDNLATILEGHVYGYELTDSSGEVVDSCWGYVTREPDSLADEILETYKPNSIVYIEED